MTIALRIIISLWGLAFGLLAIRGLIDPQVYVDQFGIEGKGAAINTLRADFRPFSWFRLPAPYMPLPSRKRRCCYTYQPCFMARRSPDGCLALQWVIR